MARPLLIISLTEKMIPLTILFDRPIPGRKASHPHY